VSETIFQTLLSTQSLWLPALTWLLGQLSASETGIQIEDGVKKRLKWMKAPEAEKAFQEAFSLGIKRYQKNRGRNEAAKAVAIVLTHIANHDTSSLDRATVLEQIFADRVDTTAISGVVGRHIFAIENEIISKEIVNKELEWLINSYLRPAFRAQKYFTEVVGFAEIIGLLKDIKENLIPVVDLEELQKDYFEKIKTKYNLITMQGISPKVHNRTIGIRMQDVFIAIEAIQIDGIGSYKLRSQYKVGETYTDDVEIVADKALQSSFIRSKPIPGLIGIELQQLNAVADQIYLSSIRERALAAISQAQQSTIDPVIAQVIIELYKELGTLQLEELLKSKHIVIQGHPGSGKSTIVRYISWAISTQNADIISDETLPYIPIIIRAVEFGDSLEKNRVDCLDAYILEQAGRFAPLFKFALSAGKAFIFIDGLDEVGLASVRSRVKERVDDLIADPVFSDNRILVTTRIVGYQPDGVTGTFPHFELKELDDKQISQFVHNWYQAIHDEMPSSVNVETEKKQLLDAVLKNASIHKMAQNPLLLTIIALIKWQGKSLPEQRVLLYDAATQTLIKSWPAIQRSKDLDDIFIKEWLAPIAEKIFNDPTSDLIDEYTLTEELVRSMMKLKSYPELEAKQETRKTLEDISFHSGIFLPKGTDDDGRNLYGFLHQTFTEYLTAFNFAGKWEDRDPEFDLKKYAHDPYWREVLLLMAGHLGTQRRAKADQLLKAITQLNSSEYENVIHRDLILAGRILGDGVPAQSEIVVQIINNLVQLWHTTKYTGLKKEIEDVFKLLKSTEYCKALMRIANELILADYEILQLVNMVGSEYFNDQLVKMLDASDVETRMRSASILAKDGDKRGIDYLFGLLEHADKHTAKEIYYRFSELHHDKGIIATLERLIDIAGSRLLNETPDLYSLGDSDLEQYHKGVLLSARNELSQPAKWLVAVMYSSDPGAEEVLFDCLSADEDWFRLPAASMLSKKQVSQAIDVLLDLTKSDEKTIRDIAIHNLAALKLDEVIPALKSLIETGSDLDKIKAAELLIQYFDNDYGRHALLNILQSSNDAKTILAAHKVLQRIPRFYIEKEKRIDLLNNPNLLSQAINAEMLAIEGCAEGIQHLMKLLVSKDLQIRFRAAKALLSQENLDAKFVNEAEATLTDLLGCDQGDIALSAAIIFDQLGRKEAYIKLAELLKNPDAAIRYQSALTLWDGQSELSFNIMKENLPGMLLDFEPAQGIKHNRFESVGNIAFYFIRDAITPSGELMLKPKKWEDMPSLRY
jgi:HEAT repeat protein